MLTETLLFPNQAIVPLGTALVYIALSLYVLVRRRFEEPIDRLIIAYLLTAALWSINLTAIVDQVPTPLPGFSWAQLAPYGLVVLGGLYWTFAQAFLLLPWKKGWIWLTALAWMLVIAASAGRWITIAAESPDWVNGDNLAFIFGAAAWLFFVLLSTVTAAIQYSQAHSPAHKNRIAYLIIATTSLILGFGLYMSAQEPFWTAGLIVTWFATGLIAYIVATEEPLDLGVAMRRTIRALVVAVVTVLVYIAGIELVHIFLGDFLAATFLNRFLDRTLLTAVVAAVLLTIVYTPIRQASEHLVNRVLFGQHYDYQAVIYHYSQAISNRLYLSDLAQTAVSQVSHTLGVDKGALFIVDNESAEHFSLRALPSLQLNGQPRSITLSKNTPVANRLTKERQPLAQYTVDLSPLFKQVPEEERQALQALNYEWFVPILKQEQLIGLLALGSKRSGQTYSAQDLRLLRTLADQTGLALENAALFDRVQRNLEEISRMKNLMDNVFDSIDNGVITTDVHGRITLFNRAAEAILAVSSERILGLPYIEALPSLAGTVLAKLMANVTGREYHYSNYEMSSTLPGRGKVDLSVNLTPLKDAQNQTQGVTIVMDDLTETKRLRAVRDIFRRYVSPAVVDRLPENPDELQLGGHRQEVTILFADIRGFTAFSEKLAPEALVEALNQYLSIAATSILMFEGTLDKFMGDGVMGIFNAPLEQKDHVLRAVRSAAAMQRAIVEYHQNIGRQRRLSFGVGLHVGEVVVGNVGMSDRMDYTAIGDAVNLAKRIQENSPGGKVLLSEAVYEQVKNNVEVMLYKEMHVKGRERPVVTYELVRVL